MTYEKFQNNHDQKISKRKNTLAFGKIYFTEPIIISSKYFGIKLLSVYEFMLCIKMKDALTKEMVNKGFDKDISKKVCEYASLVSLCLYNSQNDRVFSNGMEVLRNVTPDELKFIYDEYIRLSDKIAHRDKVTQAILKKAKNYYYKDEKILQ